MAIEHHEPYPAMVLDGRWNMVMANQAMLRFFSLFIDPFAALVAIGSPQEFQVARLCLSDKALKPYICNWQELVGSFLQRARRALVVNPNDPLLPILVREILTHPDAPDHWQQPSWTAAPAPAINMEMEVNGTRYRMFTMMAHFGAPQNVTIEELSVETFYPADEITRTRLEDLARQASH